MRIWNNSLLRIRGNIFYWPRLNRISIVNISASMLISLSKRFQYTTQKFTSLRKIWKKIILLPSKNSETYNHHGKLKDRVRSWNISQIASVYMYTLKTLSGRNIDSNLVIFQPRSEFFQYKLFYISTSLNFNESSATAVKVFVFNTMRWG